MLVITTGQSCFLYKKFSFDVVKFLQTAFAGDWNQEVEESFLDADNWLTLEDSSGHQWMHILEDGDMLRVILIPEEKIQ